MRHISFDSFKSLVWSYYRSNRRRMPWREYTQTMTTQEWQYRVVVSEVMLQQTQVDRVEKKFVSFINTFPDWQALALSPTDKILRAWLGLGYYRRALYLRRIAAHVTEQSTRESLLPNTFEELIRLPGIGPATAGSILAFAFNIPYPFIETNIRSVFIHHFFQTRDPATKIHDRDILRLLGQILEDPTIRVNPREWYYALMDYGVFIKKHTVNPSRRSVHYVRQSPFSGSNRELRSKILKVVIDRGSITQNSIQKIINTDTRVTLNAHFPTLQHEKVRNNLNLLVQEGFLSKRGALYSVNRLTHPTIDT